MSFVRKILPRVWMRFLGKLRHPQLFALAVVLLAVNLLVPDPIPWIDEALLLVASLILGRLRKGSGPASGGDPGADPNADPDGASVEPDP